MNEPVTAHDLVADVLKRPFAPSVLLAYRMHCVGCAIGRFETLAEACASYGVRLEGLLDDLNGTATVRKA
jgi:hybrid cluster-associated redox disulfide protein